MPNSNETQHNSLYADVANALAKSLPETFSQLEADKEQWQAKIYAQLSPAPQLEMGHIAFPCFPLAKECRMAPPKIAQALDETLKKHLGPHIIPSPQGPYLNFFISPEALGKETVSSILEGSFFQKNLINKTEKTMVEYSQPNTHKVLHVGHMRNLCLGNAIVRLLKYTGHDVKAVTYPGDMGTHVAKCLWYLEKNKLSPPEKSDSEKAEWLGEIYAKANLLLEDEKDTPKEDENRRELTEILKQLESEQGKYYELWKQTRHWSIKLMEVAYSWANVSFDRWFFESEMDAPSLKFVQQLYDEGKLTKDQGAIGMDLSDKKLGFCLLVKSDGTGLYATKDVELARKKFEEFGVEKNIYIVDNRQSLHFKQVFEVLKRIGFEQAERCYHLPYDVVELPDGAMSSRKGNIIPLMELINSMEETISSRHLDKYKDQWGAEEISKTATEVANGAIKYGMIRMDNNRKIVFNKDEWLKLDGETGPYLQYVCARIKSLCKKQNYGYQSDVNYAKLQAKSEIALMVKLLDFNHTAVTCSENLKTLHMTSYLYELGKLFNTFYVECPIGTLEDQELRTARLHLAKSVGETMEKGLSLLGIPVPERM